MAQDIPGERVRAAYKSAPLPIRDAFNSEKIPRIVLDMRSRYQLHIDVAGTLGREVGYLLLGLTSPMEFLGRLVDAGVDGNTAKHIANDINEQIFMPLQKVMKDPSTYVSPIRSDERAVDAPVPAFKEEPAMPPHNPSEIPVPRIDYEPPTIQTLPGSPVPVPIPSPPPRVESAPIFAPPTQPTPESAWPGDSVRVELPQDTSRTIHPVLSAQQGSEASKNAANPLQKQYGADPYREPIL